jgi:hypothetical protein
MYFLDTKYIHWRPHADRDMVPLDPKRFSVNQDAMVQLLGWAGNMTLSNSFLQGVLSAYRTQVAMVCVLATNGKAPLE